MLSETSQPRLSCCCFVLCDAVYLSGDVSAFPKKLLPMSSSMKIETLARVHKRMRPHISGDGNLTRQYNPMKCTLSKLI